MKRAFIAGISASLVLVAATAHFAKAAIVYAKLSTIQEEGSDLAAGLGAVAPADTIASSLTVIWSQEAAEPATGGHAHHDLLGASADLDRLEAPGLADPAMPLGDNVPSLASTLGGEIFASTGDHRPVEVGFLPSIPSPTASSAAARDGNAKGSGSAGVEPVVTSSTDEGAPLIDQRSLLVLLGTLGATALGVVAARRRLAKS